MYVRYKDKNCSSTHFSIKEKHQTLLRMDNLSLPALHLQVTTNDYDGYKISFEDYQIGDAPILIVNALLNQNISFCQKDDLYVFYSFFLMKFVINLDEHNCYHHNIMFIIHGLIHLNRRN